MADRMAPRVQAYDDSPYDARHTELYGATSALSASAPDGALADGAYSALYCSCSAHSLPPTVPRRLRAHRQRSAKQRLLGESNPSPQPPNGLDLSPARRPLVPVRIRDTRECPDVSSLGCLLYTSPSPRDRTRPRMPSSA